MDIQFYTNTSEKNRLNKTIVSGVKTGTNTRDIFDLQNPILNFSVDVRNYNYAYIEEVDRYYFINKVVYERNGLYKVYFEIDILMSYKDEISNLNVIISDSTSNPYYNSYIGGYDVRTTYNTLNFENNFDEEGSYIVTTIFGSILDNGNTQGSNYRPPFNGDPLPEASQT